MSPNQDKEVNWPENKISEWYIEAFSLAKKGCCAYRKYSCLIIKNGIIISRGVAINPCGGLCSLEKLCKRLETQKASECASEYFELCRCIHAEASALLGLPFSELSQAYLLLLGINAKTGEIYQKAKPCNLCKKLIKFCKLKGVFSFSSEKTLEKLKF